MPDVRDLTAERLNELITAFVNGSDFPPELEGGTARLYAGLWMTAEHESARYKTAWQSARRRAAAKENTGA